MVIPVQVVKVETLRSRSTAKDYFKVTFLHEGNPFKSICPSEVALKCGSLGQFEFEFEVVPDKFLSPSLKLVGVK